MVVSKQDLYKDFIKCKILNVSDIGESNPSTKTKCAYTLNLNLLPQLLATNNDYNQLLDTLINNKLNTTSSDTSDNTNTVNMCLSALWAYLCKGNDNLSNNISLHWVNNTNTKKHPNIKLGSTVMLYIDSFNESTLLHLKKVMQACKLNSFKVSCIVCLFNELNGYDELFKYDYSSVDIKYIFEINYMVDYYEKERILNTYQIENIRYNQDLAYNKVITTLKTRHRIVNSTYNYQIRAGKYYLTNINLVKLMDTRIDNVYTSSNTDNTNNNDTLSILDSLRERKCNRVEFNTKVNNMDSLSVNYSVNRFVIDMRHYFETLNNIYIDYCNFYADMQILGNIYLNNNIGCSFIINLNTLLVLSNNYDKLYNIIQAKDKYNFNFILDTEYYNIMSVNYDNQSDLMKNLIMTLNLMGYSNKFLIQNNSTNSVNNTLLTAHNKYNITSNNLKSAYTSLVGIIDYFIINLNCNTYNDFISNINKLKTIKTTNTGIILNINKSDNVDNYLQNQDTWAALNEFIIEQEFVNNINIVGLINNKDYKFNLIELNKCICVINTNIDNDYMNDFSHNYIDKMNKLKLYAKQYKHNDKLLINSVLLKSIYTNVHINDFNLLLKCFITDNLEFKNMVFKKSTPKESEHTHINDDDDNKDNVSPEDKNKELLQEEDEYSRDYILNNILTTMYYNSPKSDKELIKPLITLKTNNFITWYNKCTPPNTTWYTYINTIVNTNYYKLKNAIHSFNPLK